MLNISHFINCNTAWESDGEDVLSTTKQKDERSGLTENKVPEDWSEQAEFRSRRDKR